MQLLLWRLFRQIAQQERITLTSVGIGARDIGLNGIIISKMSSQQISHHLENFISKELTIPEVPLTYIDVVIKHEETNTVKTVDNSVFKSLPFARTDLCKVPVKNARILAEGIDVKKVVEMTFDLKEMEVDFWPGDTIAIQPENCDEEVNFLIERLGLTSDADKACYITLQKTTKHKNAKIPTYMPTSSTSRLIIKNYLNIRCIPKKLLIRSLIEYTSANNEKRLLEILCSKEGATLYNNFITVNGYRFITLLRLCRSCKPPLELLIEQLPRLLPRPYSISNSPLKSAQEVKIIFSILDKGLTTSMLEIISESFANKTKLNTINMYFRDRNKFKYSNGNFEQNVIMIGVGCGISPFIGFMEHMQLGRQSNNSQTTWLFTGARYRNNALFRNEIKDFATAKVIDEHFEAFSREPDSDYKYVQDHIVANSERFVRLLLLANTVVYVCADGKEISNEIESCIVNCIKLVCNMSTDSAKGMLKSFRNDSKYIEDIWM